MAEIKQTLGFNASKAIETLNQLDSALQSYNAGLNSSFTSMKTFNTQAGKTVSALKHLASNAEVAVSQLSKLSGLEIKVPTGLKEVGKKELDVDTEISRLQELYKVPAGVSKVQARSYQNAITQAAQFLAAHKKTGSKLKEINANIGSNFKGLENTLANHLAKIRRTTKVSIKAPSLNVSEYARSVQKLIPLTKGATDAQKRAWQSLSTKIAETAVKNKLSISQMTSVYGKLGQSLTGPSNKIANDMQRLVTAQNKVGDSAKKTAKSWTVSWETLARVVATQAIVRALNAIRNALSEAVTEAIAFQRATAEIGTIAGGLGGLEKIEDMTRRVSDTFNVELADATEAAYQTVSNQIASTEKDVESFLGSAAKFAKITKTDMTTAVNLLSGTLNAFGKEVSETEDVAAKFFNTIKLGRTRAEELAQGMGTINPIADKLGISMEELNAAVATLTIQGLKTDKVVTQIRGAMQAFLKPTVLMKEALAELGFETGEQVFEAYNLQEAIKVVTATTDGSAAAIAKLFPRIRGLTGVLGLATDKNNHFNKSMKEQKDALGEVYDEAYHLIITTDAEKVTKALNKLKNVFIDVFGQKFLSGVAQVFGVLEGFATSEIEHITRAYDERGKAHADLLTKELQNEKDALAERAKLLAQYAAAARKEFLAAANAAEEANQVIAASTQWAIDSMMGPVDAAVSAITKAAAEVDKVLAKATQQQAAANRSIQDFLFQRAVKAAKDDPILQISLLRKKAAEENIKSQELAAKSDFDAAAAAHSRFVALQKQAIGIADSSKETKTAADLVKFLTIRNDRYVKAVEQGKIATKEGAKGLAEAGREVIEYKADLDGLITKMQEAQKAASDKDLTPEDQVKLAKEAQVAVDNYLDTYAKGVEKFAQSADPLVRKLFQDIEAQDMTVEIDTIMTIPSNMQEIFGMIRDAANDFFQKIPVEVQLFAAERGLAVDTPKQVDEVMRQYNQTLDEQATAANAAKQAQSALDNSMAQIDMTIKSLSADVVGGLEAIDEEAGIFSADYWRQRFLPAATREFISAMDELKTGLKEGFTDEGIQGITASLEKAADGGFSTVTALRAFNEAIIQLPALQEAAGAGVGVGQQELIISNMLKTGELQEAQVQKALEETIAHNATGTAIDANKSKTDAAVASQKALTQAVKESAQAAAAQPPQVDQTNQKVTQLQGTQGAVTSEVGNTNSGIQQMSSGFTSANAAAQQLLGTLSSVSAAASTAQGPIIQNPYVEQSKGGRVGYFANGGRGTDTIPAMLSAGEHVTNARSSRRFFSQLQAMNAGQQPVFRNDGGDTYNTNVGDINVSGAGKPAVAAREVMKAIRREERRGSGR